MLSWSHWGTTGCYASSGCGEVMPGCSAGNDGPLSAILGYWGQQPKPEFFFVKMHFQRCFSSFFLFFLSIVF